MEQIKMEQIKKEEIGNGILINDARHFELTCKDSRIALCFDTFNVVPTTISLYNFLYEKLGHCEIKVQPVNYRYSNYFLNIIIKIPALSQEKLKEYLEFMSSKYGVTINKISLELFNEFDAREFLVLNGTLDESILVCDKVRTVLPERDIPLTSFTSYVNTLCNIHFYYSQKSYIKFHDAFEFNKVKTLRFIPQLFKLIEELKKLEIEVDITLEEVNDWQKDTGSKCLFDRVIICLKHVSKEITREELIKILVKHNIKVKECFIHRDCSIWSDTADIKGFLKIYKS